MKAVLLTLLLGLSFTFSMSQSADCDITQGGLTIVNAANTANVSSVCIGQTANFKFSIFNGGSSTSCTIPVNTVEAVFSFPGTRYNYNGPSSFTTGYFTWTYNSFDNILVGRNTIAIPNGLGDADVLVPVIGTTTGSASSVLNITQEGSTSDNPNNNSSSASLTVVTAPTATIAYTGSPYCNTGTATVTQTGQGGGTYSSTAGLSINPATGDIDLAASTPGSYTVTYSFSNGTCSGTTTAGVVINAQPTASITGNNSPICSGSTASFTITGTSGATVTYNINGGSNATVVLTGGSATVTVPGATSNQTLNLVSITNGTCSQSLSGTSTVVVNALPTASITGNNSPICSGGTASFTLSGTSGAIVTYNINGGSNATVVLTGGTATVTVPGATSNQTLNLVSVADANCSQNLGSSATVTVNPNLTPTVTLSASPSGAICAGTSVTFTATASNTGGGTVTYNFKVNGSSVQNGASNTYTSSSLTNGDAVVVDITVVGGTCLTATTASSNTITMVVNPNLTPTVSLSASPSGAICAGTSVTFTATASNAGGGTINYNFKVNNISVQNGASNTYTSSALANGDAVNVDITVAGGTCLTATTATSNTITMVVNPNLTPTVTLSASPSGAICAGTSVTFTATASNTGGGTINYNFKVNNISVQNGASNTYTSSALANGDAVNVDITIAGGTCLAATTATSNTITMVVNSTLTPTVSLSASPSGAICAGTSVTFTATASNTGGGTINYNFKVNNISVQNGASNTYTSSALTNGDVVNVDITVVGGTCLTATTATSNTITMVVNSTLTPTVTLSASPSGAICAGTSVTFTATASNTGGGTVTYNFKVNGSSVQSSTSNTYTSSTLVNNDAVNVDITVVGGTCLTATTATSNTITMVVNSTLTPTVSLSASPSGAICAGTSVTFTATASNTSGGTINYNFKVNNISVQNGASNTYTSSTLANGDAVNVDITVAGGTCLTATTATSNTITMVVNPNLTPTVSLSASPSGAICAGTSVTFTATASNTGGGTINYNFKVNNISVQNGASNTYTSSALANGDAVVVDITVAGGTCLTATTASSNTITMVVNSTLTPTVTLSASPSGAICAGTSVTFTATASNTGGGTVTYDFKVNGVSVQSSASNTYTSSTLVNNDAVNVDITVAGGTCLTATTATSNTITMVVTADPGNLYVNDGSTTGDTYTLGVGSDVTGNGTKCKPYATVQKAIDMATAGNTIYVDAGTYSEEFVVNKTLTLLGNNAGKDPLCTGAGHTNAATTIVATGNNNDVNSPTRTKIISITADNVTVDGFTLEGDNAQAGTYNAATGIDANSGQAGLRIRNNIVQHVAGAGIYLANDVIGGAMTSNNQVHNNRLTDISPLTGFGIGVYTGNNTYADIKDNCMTNVRKGIQGGENNSVANAGNVSPVWSGNTIESYRTGIRNNLAYGTATPVTITGNTITTVAGSSENRGIEIMSLQATAGVSISGNTIGNAVTSTQYGIYLWNNPTSNTVTVGVNTITNCAYGVFATNRDAQFGDAVASSYIVSGTNIQNAGIAGIFVDDNAANTNSATVAVTIQNSTIINNTTTGLTINGGDASAAFSGATPAAFTNQATYINQTSNGTNAPATNINATAVTFDGQTGASASPAQNFAIEDKINHKIDFLPLGFVTVKAANAFVTDIAPLAPTATNNDYTRMRNGILAASNSWTVNHTGTFNWTEANAAAAWALGNDGVASTPDDYKILVPAGLNGVTFTAPLGLGTTTIQGPGDLPAINQEGVLVFDGGDNQNWTITNMQFFDFDLSIGMFGGAGGLDAFNNTTITNNIFRLANDLNGTVAPADAGQNIGIHYSYGTNQTFSNNTFNVPGNGVSSGSSFAQMVGMQSNSGDVDGVAYDGLKIQNNIINILDAQSANPAAIFGIWENGRNLNATITISGNIFNNLAAGNNPALNVQRAFRITSKSGATKNVVYQNNEVYGTNVAFEWVTGNFTYPAGSAPVQILNNKVDNSFDAVQVRVNGASAMINNNSFTNTGRYAINNQAAGTTNATCNWYGTTSAAAITALINGSVTYVPYLNDGTDGSAATGFQPTGTCVGCAANLTATITQTADACPTGNTGALTISNVSGGVGPYSFTISGPTVNSTGATSGVFTGLAPGSYTVTATDNGTGGCTTTFAPITLTDTQAPQFSNCPAPILNQAVNAANCQASVSVPNPTVTDNCGVTTLTYALTGATTGNSPATGINFLPTPYLFNVGMTNIVYTAKDAAGNTTTCTIMVDVVNTLAGNITGTTTVAQNNATGSNITFSGSGGTRPYTFTYNISIDGGTPGPNQTVSTTGSNSVVTVSQSNAVVGQYIYTLVSITDSYGCLGTIPADNKDTITVIANTARPDFVSAVDRPLNSGFINGQVKEGYVTFTNVAPDPSTGTMVFRISKVQNFTLTIGSGTTLSAGSTVNNPDYTITDGPFFYSITSKPGTVIAGNNGNAKIGYTLTATGGANSSGIMTVSIINGTGGSTASNGDSNDPNNQSVKLFTIN